MFHLGLFKKLYSVGRIITLVSSFALMISAFIPWGVSLNMLGEKVIVNGMEGDGILTFVFGALAVILTIISKAPYWLVLILGLLAAGIGAIDFYSMYLVTNGIIGYVGYGLHVTLIAGIGIIVGSLIEICSKK